MNPSRELDALIAEHVMGWIPHEPIKRFAYPGWHLPNAEFKNIAELPPYSTDISHAFEIVHYIHKTTNLIFGLIRQEVNDVNQGYYSVFVKKYFPEITTSNIYDNWSFGQTAPHSICLAALKAVGYENKS